MLDVPRVCYSYRESYAFSVSSSQVSTYSSFFQVPKFLKDSKDKVPKYLKYPAQVP